MKRYGKIFHEGYWLDAAWWYPEADYDALAAELAGQRDENAHLCSELHRNQDRVAALEAELAMQKEILARYHKLNLTAAETSLSPTGPSADHLDSSLCGESSAGTGGRSSLETGGK